MTSASRIASISPTWPSKHWLDVDIKTVIAGGTAAVMAAATGWQQIRVLNLDSALGAVSHEKATAEQTLKETRDGLVVGSKRQDAAILDLQSQVATAKEKLNVAEAERDTLKGRLEAAQANTLRMADLAEKICSRKLK